MSVNTYVGWGMADTFMPLLETTLWANLIAISVSAKIT